MMSGRESKENMFEEWLLDWDWEENNKINLKPEAVSMGSHKRVSWKCHVCNGRWNTVLKERRGCPYCAGFKALAGFNDLATTHPRLTQEWDYNRNTAIEPQAVTKGSQKKVFWRCEKNHSWEMQINSRVQGQGCPYCNNRRVLQGYNDLQTVNPKLAEEWHPTRNGTMKSSDVVAGSKERVWWICAKGHEWQARVIQRNNGTGCPICAGKVVVKGYNDLESKHPQLAQEWDYEKNEKLPSEYACFAREKVWWICKRGHSWKAAIGDRSKGNGCAKCSEERRVSFPEKTLLFYLQKHFEGVVANYRAEWLGIYEVDIYFSKYKIAVEYDGIYGHSKEKGVARDVRKNQVCYDNGVTLIRVREAGCPATSSTSIDYLLKSEADMPAAIRFVADKVAEITGIEHDFNEAEVDLEKDAGDIYSLMEYCEKENSLLVKEPDIAKLWHPTKNGKLTPEFVQPGTPKKVWWQGACGHEWRSSVSYEVESGKCPYCTGMRVLEGFNDLATINPQLAKEWDDEKNDAAMPTTVTAGSGVKVWWKCEKKHSWKASVVSRNRGNGCPICANRILLKGYNDVASQPQLLIDWNYEQNGELKPEEVCIGKERKVWWKCHACDWCWEASVAGRMQGRGCPRCGIHTRRQNVQRTYVRKKGSLADKHPELVKEWNWERNTEIAPEKIVSGYGKKVWWICSTCEHQWEATVISRTAGRGCPKCAEEERVRARRETLLKKKDPITITHPEIAGEWNVDKNGALSPDTITAGSGKYVWWKCKTCGNEWNGRVCERTRGRASCRKCK